MAKLVVTGGAGFIGSNLVKKLIESGHNVSVIDDFSAGLAKNLHQIACQVENVSILDLQNLEKAMEGADYIFHLAAVGSVPRSISFPQNSFSVNTIGTFNVLEIARRNHTPLLFSSSSSVYGMNQELPKRERMWMQPISPYAASKLSAESLVTSYMHSYSMKTLVLRFFNVYGPHQRSDHAYAAVIPKWIDAAMNNSVIEVFGGGDSSRDFTYVDFVVDTMIDAMNRRLTLETPINVASGKAITLNTLVENLKAHFPNLKTKHLEERLGDVKHSQNDPTLLKSLFPSVHEVSLQDGLSRTIEWARQNRLNSL